MNNTEQANLDLFIGIQVYSNILDMKGIGEEWLLDANGNVIAVMIDGNLRCTIIHLFKGEVTKIL